MVDTVNVQKMEDGPRNVVLNLTNVSDGTGESAAVKADISTMSNNGAGITPVSFGVEYIEYDIQGFTRVDLAFDADTDDEIAKLSGQGYLTFDPPLADPRSTGYTGDIVLTTVGAASGASYSIVMGLKKKS